MNDLIEVVVAVTAVIVMTAAATFAIAMLYGAGPATWACQDYSKLTSLKTEYAFWYGCMVTMPDGTKLKMNEVQQIQVRKYQHKLEIINLNEQGR